MVSGGSVDGDLNTSKTNLTNFASTFTSLSGSWQGASFDGISSQVNSFVSEAISVISSQMASFSSACGLYPQYKETKDQLAQARASYNAAKKEDKYKYSGRISQLESRLQELKSQIEGLLSSISATIDSSSASGSIDVSTDTDTTTSVDAFGSGSLPTGKLTYGSFTTEVFHASNGIDISYKIYRPNYDGKMVSGLPLHMYMTGAGMKSIGEHITTDAGVGKLLKEQKITPSGIVVVPYVPSGVQYENKNYRTALTELAVEVCKQNNGDTNRISLSGHSYGAITAYRMVDEHPNVFAAMVPVSGSIKNPTAESFKNIKIWAFHGSRDNPGNNTDYKQAVKTIQALQSIGSQVTLHSYTEYPNCFHSHTHDTTFSNEFESPEGEKINPLEWALKQTKA